MLIPDVSEYLESIILSSERLFITNDFNLHVDDNQNLDSVKFFD